MFRIIQIAWLLSLVALGLTLCQLPTQAESILTPNMQALVARAKVVATTPFRTENPTSRKNAADDFAATLNALGAQMTPELAQQCSLREGQDMEAKLALIAWDRQQHPELYRELDARYLRSVGGLPGARVQQSPGVAPEHATEKYRLAWEYLLLTPVSGNPSDLWDLRVLDALTEIKNNASLLAIKQALAATTAPGMPCDYHSNRQQELLNCMGIWQDAQGLQAILGSMVLVQQQQARARKDDQIWDVPKYVRETIIAPMYHPDENAKWQDIIAAYPKAGLTTGQKTFLVSVLAAIATNPPMAPGVTPEMLGNQ